MTSHILRKDGTVRHAPVRVALAICGIGLVWALTAADLASAADERGAATTRVGPPPAVRLIVGNDGITFEGRNVAWDDLPAILEKLPDRERTVLRIAPESDQVAPARYRDALDRAGALVRASKLRYLADAGAPPAAPRAEPLAAAGGDWVFIAGDVGHPGPYPMRSSDGKLVSVPDLLRAAQADQAAPIGHGALFVRVLHDVHVGGIAAEAKQITLDALIHPPPGQAAPDLPLRAGDIVIVGTFVPGHVHPEPGAAWQDVGR